MKLGARSTECGVPHSAFRVLHSALGLWLLLACGTAGCAAARPHVDRALLAENGAGARNQQVAECYTLGCPDVLEGTFIGRSDLNFRRPIEPDGRIDLGALGRLRVEGGSVEAVAKRLTEITGVSARQVQVRVAAYNSQQIYLFGQVAGLQRAVPYQGQETVLDLLQRVGGITPGAAPGDVHVVRSHIAQGRAPEVFRVDLRAIVMDRDARTNLRLQPFDRVYVGESRSLDVEKCIPPCLRPFYELLCGLYRPQSPRLPQVTSYK
ncbi:MAG TPA: polysaccharide biosynthesis/export family protein [Gemmataceae bacterium]|jgi:protein involved in polysaccharide export with SLBB domain|nr:polysaccharide biosynthesis/export family protein [Gemmataceae bacterium]